MIDWLIEACHSLVIKNESTSKNIYLLCTLSFVAHWGAPSTTTKMTYYIHILVTTFSSVPTCIFFFFCNYFFRERGRKGERERNINGREYTDQLPLIRTPAWDWTHHPGMCADGELKQWPFTSPDNAQLTEPHWSGLIPTLSSKNSSYRSQQWFPAVPSVHGKQRQKVQHYKSKQKNNLLYNLL